MKPFWQYFEGFLWLGQMNVKFLEVQKSIKENLKEN